MVSDAYMKKSLEFQDRIRVEMLLCGARLEHIESIGLAPIDLHMLCLSIATPKLVTTDGPSTRLRMWNIPVYEDTELDEGEVGLIIREA